ncbi:hypothetical protein BgiBS90_024634 [Biomphalaria glabrata]|nr:hypothetical protein BgiBS90_024634 [Biomphalaria glabrata]
MQLMCKIEQAIRSPNILTEVTSIFLKTLQPKATHTSLAVPHRSSTHKKKTSQLPCLLLPSSTDHLPRCPVCPPPSFPTLIPAIDCSSSWPPYCQ